MTSEQRSSISDEVIEFVDSCYEKALDGWVIDKEDIVRMLEIDPHSEGFAYIGSMARELARIRNNKANLGTAFGIDYVPCKASCRYCSLGEKWGLMNDDWHIPLDSIISIIRERLSAGCDRFTLRTTEFYDIDRLAEMGRAIHAAIPGRYFLSVNTGELSREQCDMLFDAGFQSAYHTLHLREGIDTPFPPETRLRTLKAISESKLKLNCGIDPIGSEHTSEEIADLICTLREFRPVTICAMKRVGAKGTPLGEVPDADDVRIVQIAAVLRFAFTGNVSSVPPNRQAMMWGANGTSIGTGANPRDSVHDRSTVGKWRFDHDSVRGMLAECGYDV